MKTTLRFARTNKLNRRNRATGLRRGILASSAAALLMLQAGAGAANVTWNGASVANNLWSNGGLIGNWFAGAAPVNGDSVFFDNGAALKTSNTNDIVGLALNSITFNAAPNGTYTLNGNALSVGAGGITNNTAGVTQTINFGGTGVTLTAGQTWNAAAGNLQVNSNVALNGQTLTVAGGNNTTISGTVSGAGGLINNTTANLTITPAVTFSTGVTLNSGTLTATGGLTVSGGTFTGAGTLAGSLNYTSGSSSTFAGGITGAGSSVTLNNAAATLTLSAAAGTSTYGGGTFIQSGTLLIGATNTLPTTTVVTINNAAGTGTPLLSLVGFNQTIAGLNITAVEGSKTVVNIGAARTLTVNGTIALTDDTTNAGNANRATIGGAGALDLGGAVQNINVQGQNNGGGDLTINTKIQNGGINYTGTNSSTNGAKATLSLGGTTANTLTLASTVNSGILILNKTAGVDAISGPSLTVGNTPAAAGTGTAIVQLAASNQINTATNVILNGDGTFDRAGNTQTLNGAGIALKITNGNVVDTVGGAVLTIGGGGLTMSGGVIGSAVGGATTVLNADVTATSNAVTGAALIKDNVTLASGQRTFTVTAGTSVFPAPDLNITGVISDGGAGFIKTGTGTMQIGGNNTYTGQTIINNGVLALSAGGTTPLGTANAALNDTLVNTGGTVLLLNNANTGAENITINGAGFNPGTGALGALAVVAGGTGTVGGTITVATNSTIMADAGSTLNLNGSITKTGVTLTFAGGPAGAGVINVNGTISGYTGANNSDLNVNGVTTNLNAGNTYLGKTNITSVLAVGDGILNANAPSALPIAFGRSQVTMDGGAVLAGLGGSTLNLSGTGAGPFPAGSNQSIASLDGFASSKVTLGANTLTIGYGNGVNIFGNAGATFAGVISDGGAGGGVGAKLVKDETSTQTLTGVNTYTGGTTINQGKLQISAGGNLSATGAVTVNSGGILGVNLTGGSTFAPLTINNNVGGLVLANNAAGTQTIAGNITGGGALTQSGAAGTTILMGTGNTYSGLTTISAGTLQIGSGAADGSIGTGNILDNATLNVNSTNTITLANNISGSGVLNQNGAGTTILTGANSYSGTTTINAGILQVGAGAAVGTLGTGNVVDLATLTFNRSDVVTINNLISGAGGIVNQSGAGTTILTNTDTYTGVTNVTAGTLQVGNGATGNLTGTPSVQVSAGATLATDLIGGGTFTPAIALNGATATLNAIQTGTNILSGAITGTGVLNQTGVGTTILTNNGNNYTGVTTISAGVLQIGNGGATGNITGGGNIVDNATFNVNLTSTITLANVISGTGVLNQNGTGGTILTGANTYSGITTINNGFIQIGNGGASGSLGTGNVVDNAVLAFTLTSSPVVANNISGTGQLIQNGPGTTILTGTNTYSGTTFANGGVLQVGNGGTTGTLGTGGVVVGGQLTFNRSDTITVGNVISGAGGILNQSGTGRTILTATDTYTGVTNVTAGILQVGNGAAGNLTGTPSVQVSAGATLATNLVGGGTFTPAIALNGATATLNAVQAGTNTLSGPITGAGVLNQTGNGTTILTNNGNTYAGTTTISAGVLQIGNGGATGSIGAGNIVDNAALNVNLTGAFILPATNIISGTGALNQNGTGNTTLQAANTYTGATTVNAGTLTIGNGVTGSISGVSPVTVLGGATLALNLAPAGVFANNVTNAGTVNALSAGTNTISGIISGAGVFNQNGAGTTILTGANSYTGATTVNAGTLQLGNGVTGSISPASAVVVAAPGTLATNLANNGILTNAIANAGTVNAIQVGTNTLSGVISGAGTFTQNGTGTTILSGANTYTGGTTLNTGTLAFGNVSAFGKGNLTVNGGTLQNATLGTTNVPLNVNIGAGNFVSNGGIYVAIVGGPDGGTQLHDQITTTGMVTGKNNGQFLTLTQTNGYLLKPGDKATLVSATGGVAGGTALGTPVPGPVGGLAAFSNTPLLVPTVNLYTTAIILEAMQGSFAGLNGFALGNGQFLTLTPNQLSAATALDSVAKANNFKTGGPNSTNPAFLALGYIDNASAVSLRSVPGLLDRLTPDELASIFSIGTELSSLQNTNLMRHFDEFRAEGNSAAVGLVNNLNSVSVSSSNPDGMEGPRGRGGKEIRAPRQYQGNERWGTFLVGSGNFSRVGSTSNAAGYDFTTGGVTVGIEYKVMENLVVGVDAGYANTSTDLVNGGKVDVNGGQFGIFASYFNSGFYVDAAGHYGVADYRTRRAGLGGLATGSPNGDSWSAFINAGYDFKVGGWTIGPTVNFQYNNTRMDRFTETGSLAPLTVSAHNGESIRTDVGFRAFYDCNVGGVILRPEVRAGWQHEYSSASEVLTSNFATLGGNAFNVNGPVVGRDALLVGTGVTMVWNTLLSTFVAYDGELARANTTSHSVSGGVRIKF